MSNPPKTFIILFVRGGGSTYLAELINQIDRFVCLREPKLTIDYFSESNLEALLALQEKNDRKFSKRRPQRVEDCAWVGAKVKLYDQLSEPLQTALMKSQTPVVFLHRTDLLRHAVGLCRKQLAPRSVTWSIDEKLPPCEIPLDLFIDKLDWVQRRGLELYEFRSKLIKNRIQVHTTIYESLCASPCDEIYKLGKFVGEELRDVGIQDELLPVKHTNVDWDEDVLNSDELRNHFIQSNKRYISF